MGASPMSEMRRWFPFATLCWLGVLMALVVAPMRLPEAQPEIAAPSVFSAQRARRHVEAVARAPHPAGSPAAATSRDYILGRLRALGLDPQVQTASAVRSRAGLVTAGRVENIAARIPGAANTKAVLLVCHYESVAGAPGANDDGNAVGVLIETARALLAGPRPRNDVILLFDFEEAGLLGAKAFTREHPWARDVGLVLNFDARGTGGPSMMFETSEGNGWMVREVARAAPNPVASSLSYEVYKRMPNDTDLTVFKRTGFAGLNFAYIESPQYYHTALDDLAHLSERTLQHQGDYALSLSRAFGAAALGRVRAPDAVYFRAPWNGLVVYSAESMWLLALATAAGFAALAWLGFRRKELTRGGLAAGMGVFLLALAALPAAAAGLWGLAGPLFFRSMSYRQGVYAGALAAMAAALFLVIYSWAARRVRLANLAMGALACVLIALLAACRWMPGATYVLQWPLVASLAVFYALIADGGRWRVAVLLAGAAVPVYLLGGIIQQLFVALGMAGAAPAAALMVVLGGLLIPQLLAAGGAGYAHAAGAGALAFVLLAGGLATLRYDAAHPLRDNLFYALDSDTGNAVWASYNTRPDAFTSKFLKPPQRGRLPQFTTAECTWSPTLPASLPPPEVTLLEKRFEGGIRAARMRIRSRRGASGLVILVTSRDGIDSGAVDGRRWGGATARGGIVRPGRRIVTFDNLPPEGAEFAFVWKGEGPLKLQVIDSSDSLPVLPGLPSLVRPPYLVRAPVWRFYNDTTLVSRSLTLE